MIVVGVCWLRYNEGFVGMIVVGVCWWRLCWGRFLLGFVGGGFVKGLSSVYVLEV